MPAKAKSTAAMRAKPSAAARECSGRSTNTLMSARTTAPVARLLVVAARA